MLGVSIVVVSCGEAAEEDSAVMSDANQVVPLVDSGLGPDAMQTLDGAISDAMIGDGSVDVGADAAAPDAAAPFTPDAAPPDAAAPFTPDAAPPDAAAPFTPDAAQPDAAPPPDAVPPQVPDAAVALVTYAPVQALFASKCDPCHTTNGDGQHNMGAVDIGQAYADSQLPAYSLAGTKGAAALLRIQNGSMPFGAGCSGDPVFDAGNANCLSQDEQDVLQAWIDDGQQAP